ncbi:MAG: DUF4843 domain-containing protein [Candidatus Pseudobacter hemicellulosilyticus]|uniref:DUF4843 domain-containing protein n=1 Tax=Candidatus Pseudobacter hemicellulosilyticus TaxID=3121375 RepID=A0AAJ6BFY2_9BACT|nr:MAG: DUF4843 domain-containing protein [Pseudobacter sp.]
MTKKISIPGLLVALVTVSSLLATSCTKDPRLDYTSPASVYFFTDSLLYIQDSVTFSFAVHESSLQVDTVAIPLKLMGDAEGKDRSFTVVADPAKTTAQAGVHYDIITPKVKAGQFKDSLLVKVYKTADLASKEVRIALRITDGGELLPGATERLNYTVKLNNILSKPDNWDMLLIGFFGPYSEAKYRFIIDVTGLAVYNFRTPTGGVDFQYYMYLKQILRAALQEQGPIYDESNNPISFPA